MSANTLLTSVLNGGSNSHATVAEEANAFSTDFVSAGVVGTIGVNSGSGGTGSFCVNADASPDMGVTIKAGQGYVTATPSGQNSQVLRVRAAADYTAYTINANASGSTKYDWVYLTISATNANTPSSDASNVASFVTSRSSSNTTDNGSPPTYGLVLAVITVANAASSITNGNIQDKRIGSSLTTSTASSSTGWNALGQVPTTVTALGNRSYSMVYNAIDITGTVSNGMRLKTSRTVPAPTQCTSLNGTTQFYNKTSPAGMTFTDDFTVSAWVKLTSYNGASNSTIASRYNNTSGWAFYTNASGGIELVGWNAGSANFSRVVSYQSVPLNKWVHVSANLDMSAFSTNTDGGATGSCVTFDGVNVPTSVSRGGTNPTALIQAGNLEIGSQNAGTLPFPGKIAQVAIFSAKITNATMLTYISQGLAGTETSLISAYSFNNAITDLNANANNLTANGSAVATNTDSPFGGQADGTISSTLDYGVITKTAFSTNTTLTVQVPEGCTIPTTGGVSAVSYGTVSVPYGFPKQQGKWRVAQLWRTQNSTASNATFAAFTGLQLIAPIGSWKVGWKAGLFGNNTQFYWTLSSTSQTGLTSTTSDLTLQASQFAPAAGTLVSQYYLDTNVDLAAATTYLMYTLGAATNGGIAGSTTLCEIFAECAHL